MILFLVIAVWNLSGIKDTYPAADLSTELQGPQFFMRKTYLSINVQIFKRKTFPDKYIYTQYIYNYERSTLDTQMDICLLHKTRPIFVKK